MAEERGTSAAFQAAKWLTIVGALNWGLVGFFDWDLVRAILGGDTSTGSSAASRVIYAVVGVAGVALAALSRRGTRRALPGRPGRALSDQEVRA